MGVGWGRRIWGKGKELAWGGLNADRSLFATPFNGPRDNVVTGFT